MPLLFFKKFWVGKDTLSVLKLFQIKVTLLKNAKNLKKLLKIRGFLSIFFGKIHLTNGSKSEQLNSRPSQIVRPLG